jgi:hypothetical protein
MKAQPNPTAPYNPNQLKGFASKADEDKFWDDLEKERVAHDPALEFSRFHTERIAAGRDKTIHYALIDAIRALTRTLESPSVKTITSQLPSGRSVSMTVHEIRGASPSKGEQHGKSK